MLEPLDDVMVDRDLWEILRWVVIAGVGGDWTPADLDATAWRLPAAASSHPLTLPFWLKRSRIFPRLITGIAAFIAEPARGI